MSLIFFVDFSTIAQMGQIKNEELLNKIAHRIKELRENSSVTQEQFYFDTGIHLARIETGKNNLTVSTLEAVCKYFDISLEEFFKGL